MTVGGEPKGETACGPDDQIYQHFALPKGAAHRGRKPPKSGANHKKGKEIGHAATLAPVDRGINSAAEEPLSRNGNGRL